MWFLLHSPLFLVGQVIIINCHYFEVCHLVSIVLWQRTSSGKSSEVEFPSEEGEGRGD